MPRRSKGARLYRDPKRGQFVIRDGGRFIRVGTGDAAAAEKVLAAYIAKKHSPDATATAPLIADVLNAYATDIVPGKATASNISYNLGNLLRWWGAKTTQEVTARNCRAYAEPPKSQSGAAADLKFLRAACNHWSREYAQLVPQPVVWRPAESRPRERWLTKSEAARLLWAARRYQHIKRLILIGLYTGSRPGVILRLQWDQIDLSTGVMARIRPGEAAHANKRSPNVRLGKKILAHLRRWRMLDGTVSYLCHLDGRRVVDPHTAWRKVIKKANLPGVTPHTLRHTRATYLMQAGVPIWEAASALGMTVKTLEMTYGHHSPDWQRMAAEV